MPKELNQRDTLINLAEIPIESKYLSFRDMENGDKLITEKIAKEMQSRLEELAARDNRRFLERLRALQFVETDDYFILELPQSEYPYH